MTELVVKAAGAACVMGAAVLYGEAKTRALTLRVEQLLQFQRSLKLLLTEISFARSMLPFAFRNVAKQSASPVRELYLAAAALLAEGTERGAGEAWTAAVRQSYPSTCYTAADRQVIEGLAVSLGVSGQEEQVKQIQLTLQRLEYALEEARENKRRNEKMWRYLCFAGGAALVILLL